MERSLERYGIMTEMLSVLFGNGRRISSLLITLTNYLLKKIYRPGKMAPLYGFIGYNEIFRRVMPHSFYIEKFHRLLNELF